MKFLLIFMGFILTACATTPPQQATYLLRSDKHLQSREVLQDSNIYLGGLTLASYIDQQGLVLETAPGQVHEARFFRWAEPLSVSLPGFLQAEISAGLGKNLSHKKTAENPVRVDVRLDQLHGTTDGKALLVGFWSITDTSGSRQFKYVETAALDNDGYDALVNAQRRLLRLFALEISESLQGVKPVENEVD